MIKNCLMMLIVIQIVLLSYRFSYSRKGVSLLLRLKYEKVIVDHEIIALKNKICNIEQDITHYKTHLFYYEKTAREQLHWAHYDELVFFVPPKKKES